jgi:putative PIN family toxin of toxin-antitoxin system
VGNKVGLEAWSDSIYAISVVVVVVDTNVFVAALRSGGGPSREIIRRCLNGRYQPIFSNALWLEYEDLLGRDVWTNETTEDDRRQVLAAVAAASQWVKIFYGWRPNLRDEGDNHLVELAIAGGAEAIVTYNSRDLWSGDLRWPNIAVLTPPECLEKLK